jgi:hypothetical protein
MNVIAWRAMSTPFGGHALWRSHAAQKRVSPQHFASAVVITTYGFKRSNILLLRVRSAFYMRNGGSGPAPNEALKPIAYTAL